MRIQRDIAVPRDAAFICQELQDAGYDAYVVGGAVRDAIIGRDAGDWDITTSALPHDVLSLFSGYRIIETGIRYGTVVVIVNDVGYEITTFREDGEYSDGQRPDGVNFDGVTIDDDLSRRDFTINAMAYDPINGVLLDPFGGLGDIKNGIIKCVGRPADRFATGSDRSPIRMMRAFRLRAQLGFLLDSSVIRGVVEFSHHLRDASIERIVTEFNKILLSPNPDTVLELYYCGLLMEFAPILCNLIDRERARQLLAVNMDNQLDTLIIRLSLLFRDVENPAEIIRNLRYSNDVVDAVGIIAPNISALIPAERVAVRQWVRRIGMNNFFMLIHAIHAAGTDMHPVFFELLNVIAGRDCCSMSQLCVNGDDIKTELGVAEGKEIGTILNLLLDAVITDQIPNVRCVLLEAAEKICDEIISK